MALLLCKFKIIGPTFTSKLLIGTRSDPDRSISSLSQYCSVPLFCKRNSRSVELNDCLICINRVFIKQGVFSLSLSGAECYGDILIDPILLAYPTNEQVTRASFRYRSVKKYTSRVTFYSSL